MDISDTKIGIESTIIPPFETNLKAANMYEKLGFDSLWFGDHIMSLWPDAIWTPDIVNMASYMKNPHDMYNAFPTMAVVANNTKKVFLGTSVTESFRHPPSLLAHMILTIDHISKGRVILGIGAGEGENIVPYGIKWEKPIGRLEEAIKIIKLLWKHDKKVNFEGNFWKLKDAVLSLKPYKKNKPPPIWIGAFKPKMLELTGKIGDGWLPYNLNPKRYKERLEIIQRSAKNEGRNPDEITSGIEVSVIIDEKIEECDKMIEHPLVKNHLLFSDNETFKEYGLSHPFGDNFYGILDYIPTRYDKKTLIDAFEKIPIEMCKDFYLVGTPDDIIGKLEEYAKIGVKHIVIHNLTSACDIRKVQSSTLCIKKVLDHIKEDELKMIEPIPG
ncbi:MAG: LLM class flavin-dependent oxidoreductase [Candidatus Hermodarchaeota archaeon]